MPSRLHCNYEHDSRRVCDTKVRESDALLLKFRDSSLSPTSRKLKLTYYGQFLCYRKKVQKTSVPVGRREMELI